MKIRRTCRDVTRLVLESQDRRLGTLEALSLRLHWLACGGWASATAASGSAAAPGG